MGIMGEFFAKGELWQNKTISQDSEYTLDQVAEGKLLGIATSAVTVPIKLEGLHISSDLRDAHLHIYLETKWWGFKQTAYAKAYVTSDAEGRFQRKVGKLSLHVEIMPHRAFADLSALDCDFLHKDIILWNTAGVPISLAVAVATTENPILRVETSAKPG